MITTRVRRTFVAAAAALLAAPLLLVAPAQAAAPARILDAKTRTCSQGAFLQVTLEKDGRQLEVDVEIYGRPSAQWSVTIAQAGGRSVTLQRTADYDGELDLWRYLPDRRGADQVSVTARSRSGERCSLTVRG